MTRSPWPLTLIFAALHLAVAAALPLIEDEAYYALWATAPAWGYYDHPPMVAWMIAAGQVVFGETPMGVRIVPVLGFSLILPMVWRMAILATGCRATASWAGLFWGLSALVLALGNFATPDAPSALFWAATLWAMAEALRSGRMGWWLLAGLCAGLGIQSKFTNLFLCLGILLWLAATAEGRAAARTWRPWAAVVVAIAAVLPLILWNAANGWVGLERQFGRIDGGEVDPLRPGLFLLTAALVFSPVLAWFALRGLARPAPPIRGLLAATSAVAVGYFLWHSVQNNVAAHWLVPLHAGFAVLAGIGARDLSRRWRQVGAGIAAGLGAVFLGLAFKPGTPLFTTHSPPNQVRGWTETAAELNAILDALGAEWIATNQYGLTGHLAWYLDRPVWQVTQPERYLFRGPLPPELCDVPAVLIERADREEPVPFADLGPSVTIARSGGDAVLFTYRLRTAAGLDGCP